MVSKLSKFVIVTALVMVVSFVLGGLFTLPSIDKFDEASLGQEYSLLEEAPFVLDGVDKVYVSTVSADVNFIPVSSGEYKAVMKGFARSKEDRFLPTLTVIPSGNNLFIEIKHPKSSWKSSVGALQLDVYVPVLFDEVLDVSTVSGDIFLGGFAPSKGNFVSTSGDMVIVPTQAFAYDVASVSGDLELSSIIGAGKVSTVSGDIDVFDVNAVLLVESISGDVEVTYKEVSSGSTFTTTSGDVDVVFPKDSSVSLDLDSTSGDIAVSSFVSSYIKDHEFKGMSGAGEYLVTIHTVSGDINIV